ncbi:MAG: hypothetical protein RBJ76_13360 [Stenomitos frigidus ULC029]
MTRVIDEALCRVIGKLALKGVTPSSYGEIQDLVADAFAAGCQSARDSAVDFDQEYTALAQEWQAAYGRLRTEKNEEIAFLRERLDVVEKRAAQKITTFQSHIDTAVEALAEREKKIADLKCTIQQLMPKVSSFRG